MAAMHHLRPLSVLLILAGLLSGCSAPAPAQAPKSEPPQPGPSEPAGATPTLGGHKPPEPAEMEAVDIRGRVVQARRNAQGEPPVGTLQIEGTLEPGTRYDKATVRVSRETKIFLGHDGKPTSFSFLHEGDLVEVTFSGPVAESYPVQATAARIVILEHTP